MKENVGRTYCTRGNDIKTDLKEVRCEDVDGIELAQYWTHLMSFVADNETSGFIKGGEERKSPPNQKCLLP